MISMDHMGVVRNRTMHHCILRIVPCDARRTAEELRYLSSRISPPTPRIAVLRPGSDPTDILMRIGGTAPATTDGRPRLGTAQHTNRRCRDADDCSAMRRRVAAMSGLHNIDGPHKPETSCGIFRLRCLTCSQSDCSSLLGNRTIAFRALGCCGEQTRHLGPSRGLRPGRERFRPRAHIA